MSRDYYFSFNTHQEETSMKPLKSTLIVGAALAALVMLVGTFQMTTSAQSNTGGSRWEHLAMAVEAEQSLGDETTSRKIIQLGSEGWELVDVESLSKDGTTTKLVYCFKRPK